MSAPLFCRGCREPAEPDDLLEIVEVRTGRTFYCHRPTLQRPCFRWTVSSRAEHRLIPKAATE